VFEPTTGAYVTTEKKRKQTEGKRKKTKKQEKNLRLQAGLHPSDTCGQYFCCHVLRLSSTPNHHQELNN